jgi:hypothetical protein
MACGRPKSKNNQHFTRRNARELPHCTIPLPGRTPGPAGNVGTDWPVSGAAGPIHGIQRGPARSLRRDEINRNLPRSSAPGEKQLDRCRPLP